MIRRQNRMQVYLLLLAFAIAAVTAYYLTGEGGGREGVYSHREYMQLVEESRARRMQPPPPQQPSRGTEN